MILYEHANRQHKYLMLMLPLTEDFKFGFVCVFCLHHILKKYILLKTSFEGFGLERINVGFKTVTCSHHWYSGAV